MAKKTEDTQPITEVTDNEEKEKQTQNSITDSKDEEVKPKQTRNSSGNEGQEEKHDRFSLEKFCRTVTYICCFLTGQYASKNPSPNKSSLMTLYFFFITLLVCFSLNLVPLVITIADWVVCDTSEHYNMYFNVCYSIILHPEPHTDHIPDIVLRDADDNVNANSLSDNEDNLSKFTIYARVMLLITSFSSITSYLFFIIAFMKLYIFPHFKKTGLGTKHAEKIINALWCIRDEDDSDDIIPLHPFNDQDNSMVDIEILDTDISTSTRLSEPYQALSYYLLLFVNVAINIAMLVVFVYGQYGKNPRIIKSKLNPQINNSTEIKIEGFEIVGVVTYIYSLFCTLFSCFIFSKLAYGIQNKYKILNTMYLQHVNKPADQLQEIHDFLKKRDGINHDNDDLRVRLYYLQERDKDFSKVAKSTIKQFEFWFFFHWILYIVSSFLSLSLFFEVLIYYINSALPKQTPNTGGIDFNSLEIIFLGLFSASNILFFLYPCIRAASVTNSRQVQISELNKIYMKYKHVTPELKDHFTEFLKSQNAGFDLHILCARVPFGFSVAYISIFIALFSVLLKVASSI